MTRHLILVVESDPVMQAIWDAIFRGHRIEFNYHLVQTAEAALEFLRQTNVDLLVLAAALPRITGLDVLQLVRAEEETKDIPVVIISAAENHDERLQALHYGADHYQGKDFSVEEFLARVRRLLEREAPMTLGAKVLAFLIPWRFA